MKKLVLFALSACSFCAAHGQADTAKSNDNFSGRWHGLNSPDTIYIQRDGDNYLMDNQGTRLTFKLADGILKSDEPAPSKIIYNSMNDHLFWHGKEFEYFTIPTTPPTAPQPETNNMAATETAPPPQAVSPANTATAPASSFGIVSDNLSGPLASNESALFRSTCDANHPNKMIFFDVNFHEEDPSNREMVNAIYSGLENTHRLERVPFEKYQQHANDSIFYIITYSDMRATATNTPNIDKYGNALPNYNATLKCKVTITDYSGTPVASHSFTQGDGVHLIRYESEYVAVRQSAKKLQEKFADFFTENFPVTTNVLSIDDANSDGAAKSILINGGENMGLYSKPELKMKIMAEGRQIGEVKVKSVDDKTTACKVLDGGDIIAAKIKAGTPLQAISEW